MNQQEHIKNLMQLINDNPELPVICMVDSDIVADDGFYRWVGEIGRSNVKKHAHHEEHCVEWDDRPHEVCTQVCFDPPEESCESCDLREPEGKYGCSNFTNCPAEKAFVDSLDWVTAIIVNIDVP